MRKVVYISLEDFPLENESTIPATYYNEDRMSSSRTQPTNTTPFNTGSRRAPQGTTPLKGTSSTEASGFVRKDLNNNNSLPILPDQQREAEMRRILERRRERRESEQVGIGRTRLDASNISAAATANTRFESHQVKDAINPPSASTDNRRERKFDTPSTTPSATTTTTTKQASLDSSTLKPVTRRQVDYSTPNRVPPTKPYVPLRATTTTRYTPSAPSPYRATELWNKMVNRSQQ